MGPIHESRPSEAQGISFVTEKHDTAVTVSFFSDRGGWLVKPEILDGALEIVTTPAPIA